jgi:uncharacterized protein YjiS (DUF1127 family)
MRYARCAIQTSDWRALTPSRQAAITRELIRQAHAARTRAIGKMLTGWVRYLRRRRQRRELAELKGMDDLALRDTGITRFEIDEAIRSGTSLAAGIAEQFRDLS